MGPALERQDPNSRPAPGQPWAPGRVRTARPSHLGSSVVPILLQEAPQASDEGLGQASHSRMGKLRCRDWVDLPSCQRARGWFLPQPWPAGGTEAFAGQLRVEGPVSEPPYVGGRARAVPMAALLRTCRHEPWVSTGSGTGGPTTEKSLVGRAAGARQGLSPRSGFCAALTQCCKSWQEGWPRALGGPGVGALEGPSRGKRGFLGSHSPRNPSALTGPQVGVNRCLLLPPAPGHKSCAGPGTGEPLPGARARAGRSLAGPCSSGSPVQGRARGGKHIPTVLQLPPEWRAGSQACRLCGLHGRGHLWAGGRSPSPSLGSAQTHVGVRQSTL